MIDPFSMMGGQMGGFSSTSQSFGGGFGGGSGFSSVSSSTSFVNGKQVHKTVKNENGVETVEVRENGVLTKKTVNGQHQAISGGGQSGNQSVQATRRSGSSRGNGNLFDMF
jgi:hypothetical protein